MAPSAPRHPAVEAGARRLYEQWRAAHPGTLTWDTDSDIRKAPFYDSAQTLHDAGMLTLPSAPVSVDEVDIESAAELLWESVDERGIRGRLYREDCTYLARTLASANRLSPTTTRSARA